MKRNATFGCSVPWTCLFNTPAGSCPAVKAANLSPIGTDDSATTARRWSKCDRPVLAVKQTSANDVDGCDVRYLSNRPASSFNAPSLLADRVRRWSGRSTARCVGWATAASSTTIWTLVPLKPNELTPAIRGSFPAGQGIRLVGIVTGISSSEM